MILFPDGLSVTPTEYSCLLHLKVDPAAWLLAAVHEKARLRRNAVIVEWRPRLFADSSVTDLPADAEALCALIMARDDYKTRLQTDAAHNPPILLDKHATAIFEGTSRVGRAVRRPDRVPGDATVELFPAGINLADIDCQCILAYIQDVGDWIIGALLGQINRGKKMMIAQYHPIILADPSVTTMPATEDGLIAMIVARDDYQTRNN